MQAIIQEGVEKFKVQTTYLNLIQYQNFGGTENMSYILLSHLYIFQISRKMFIIVITKRNNALYCTNNT